MLKSLNQSWKSDKFYRDYYSIRVYWVFGAKSVDNFVSTRLSFKQFWFSGSYKVWFSSLTFKAFCISKIRLPTDGKLHKVDKNLENFVLLCERKKTGVSEKKKPQSNYQNFQCHGLWNFKLVRSNNDSFTLCCFKSLSVSRSSSRGKKFQTSRCYLLEVTEPGVYYNEGA